MQKINLARVSLSKIATLFILDKMPELLHSYNSDKGLYQFYLNRLNDNLYEIDLPLTEEDYDMIIKSIREGIEIIEVIIQ